MSYLDYAIILLYFGVVIGLGFWYRRRAAKGLDDYFLAGKRMHWLMLAMSGSVSNFDITGTMWIVSMLFLLGMRSMWIHWMWGWMMGAFFLAYMGKWVRRSEVMTGAEWMLTRFGRGWGGQVARMSAAIMAVITMSGMIGYAFQGIGKFAHVYIPALSANTLALLIIGTTTLYVLLGGLYSVITTDVIQTVIVTVSAIIIAGIAYVQLSAGDLAAALPEDWVSLTPVWRIEGLTGDGAAYQLFGALLIVWVVKGLLLNAGGPGGMYEFQRFLAARDPRDAAKTGAAWSVFLVVRWGMCMGLALLAMAGLSGITDPETTMPIVLHTYLPAGLRGLVIAGLLAAFMSTFSSTVNAGASYLIRDFWQPLTGADENSRGIILASYVATVAVVVFGIAIGFQAESIAQIWEWLMMALGGGVIMPNVLRWYWWRFNGWGYAAGTLGGMLLSLVPLFRPELPMYVTFPIIAGGSLAGCLAGTWLTPAVAADTLTDFYTKVRPFGLWRPVLARSPLPDDIMKDPKENPWRTLLNAALGMAAITSCYLAPMYLVGHWHLRALACVCVAGAAMVALRFTWYPYLPERR